MAKNIKVISNSTVLLDADIDNCAECVFSDGEFSLCTCLNRDITLEDNKKDFPAWCPLDASVEKCQIDYCNCFDIPISFFERCLWCKLKHICKDEYGDLAYRDSDYCRMLHVHLKFVL